MSQNSQSQMATVPIPSLLRKVALPIMISMTIQALYNVIDSIFVSRISEHALNAVSLAFPIQNIIIAVAVGISVGMNAILSRSLGEKNQEKANSSALHGLFLTTIASVLLFFYGIFFSKTFYSAQTSVPEIIAYGEEYLTIICIWSFSIFYAITLERCLQATGRTIYTMIAQGSGAIINIILDPIFIFGWFGFPAMEVRGAAIATVIGQLVCLGLNIYFNGKKNKELNFAPKQFSFSLPLCKEILAIAIPSMAMGSINSLLVYGLNQILMTFTATATAVLGVYYKLQSFIFMPVYGLTNGMIPILAFNYGATQQKRFMETLKLGLLWGVGIMVVGTLSFQVYPEFLIGLFLEDNIDSEMLAIGIPAVKIISFSFPVAGICIVISATFQALGHGMLSLWSTILRQLVIQLPCAYALATMWGLKATWYSFILAETSAVLFMSLFFFSIYRKKLKNL